MFSVGIIIGVTIVMPVVLAGTFYTMLRISLKIRKPKGEQG